MAPRLWEIWLILHQLWNPCCCRRCEDARREKDWSWCAQVWKHTRVGMWEDGNVSLGCLLLSCSCLRVYPCHSNRRGLQQGWEQPTAHGQERRNGSELQEGDVKQDTSKSKWQELSVYWLPGEKQTCFFGESSRITGLPERALQKAGFGEGGTDDAPRPFQPPVSFPAPSAVTPRLMGYSRNWLVMVGGIEEKLLSAT